MKKTTVKVKPVKIKPKNVMLELPKLIHARDYHEFGLLQDSFNEFVTGKNKIKFEELQIDDYGYFAIFYLNKKDDEFKSLYKETMALSNGDDENGDY